MAAYFQSCPVYLKYFFLFIVEVIEGNGVLVLWCGKTELQPALYLYQKSVVKGLNFETPCTISDLSLRGITFAVLCPTVVRQQCKQDQPASSSVFSLNEKKLRRLALVSHLVENSPITLTT